MISEDGERGCLAAPRLRGSEFVWRVLGKFGGRQKGRWGAGASGWAGREGGGEEGGAVTARGPFRSRKPREGGVFWFCFTVLLFLKKKKKDN